MGPGHPGYKVPKPRPVWERNGQDTDQSWPYFKAYRDLVGGVRTLARVQHNPSDVRGGPPSRQNSPTLDQLQTWLAEHSWGDRVAEYDRHMDGVEQGELELLARKSGSKKAAERQALLQPATDLVIVELQKALATAQANDFTGFKVNELARFFDVVLKAKRLEDGESTEVVEERMDLSHLSPEETLLLAKAMRGKER